VTILLAYHRVLPDPPKDNVHVLPRRLFERQVDLMAQSGLEIASPDQFRVPAPAGRHRVGITFDDGFQSDLQSAELLHKHGMKALFFVPTATIGAPGFLGAADLRTLVQMGMSIGSHSHEHVHVTPESAERQARTSKEILTQLLGSPVEDFAFPGGVCTAETIAMTFEAGFKRVFTIAWGVNGESQFRTGVFRRNCLVQGMTDAQFMNLISAKNAGTRQAVYMIKQLALRCLPQSSYARLQRWYCSFQRP
jgi:peptidoglycan/xylan/chitin deacetylase (PgdA/CDA1 family)